MTPVEALRHYNAWRIGDDSVAPVLLLTPTQITAAINAACDDLERMQAENEKLRTAMEFYAQLSNHKRDVRNVGPRYTWTMSRVAEDRGSRARMALMVGCVGIVSRANITP